LDDDDSNTGSTNNGNSSPNKSNTEENPSPKSTEDNKKFNESPTTSVDEEEEDEEEQEIKRPEQQLDFSGTRTWEAKSEHKSKRVSSSKSSFQQFYFISSSFLSYYFTLFLTSLTNFYSALFYDLSTLSEYLTSSWYNFLNYLTNYRIQMEIPLWFNTFVLRYKIVWLGLFYIHLGLWICFSLFLIGINIITFFFGPWAIFPIGSMGVGLYIHSVITRKLLEGAGASTNEFSWIETPIHNGIQHMKKLTLIAYNIAIQKYQSFSHFVCDRNGNKQ